MKGQAMAEQQGKKRTQEQKQPGANPLELHFINQAYQRGEISFEQWLRQAVAWSHAMLDTKKDAA